MYMYSFFPSRYLFKQIVLFPAFFAIAFQVSAAEKIYAGLVTHTSGNTQTSLIGCGPLGLSPCYKPTVNNPLHAISNVPNYARLFASPGLLVGLGSYDGIIELEFPETRPANSTVYIRIGQGNGLLDYLIGGSLAESLAGLAGSLLFGNQIISVQAKNGNSTIETFSSTSDFGSDRAKIVVDKNGYFYLAVTPSSEFNRVRVVNSASSLAGLGTEFTLDVYHAFYFSESSCVTPEFTSFDGSSGLNLELLPSNQNLGKAIDGDLDTFSEFSAGLIDVGLGSNLIQHVYFSGPSQQHDDLNLTFSFSNLLANVGLLQSSLESVRVVAFLEGESVYDESLDIYEVLDLLGIVDLDLLGLLGDYGYIQIPVKTGSPFDRVSISYQSFIEINAIGGFRLHDVSVSYGFPEVSEDFSLSHEICSGQNLSLITPDYPGMTFEWYDAPFGGNHLGTTQAGEWLDFENIEESLALYVSAKRVGCIQESVRGYVEVSAFENPSSENIEITPQGEAMIDDWGNLVYVEGSGVVRLVPAYNDALSGTFTWYWDENLLIPVINGQIDDDGVLYFLEDDEVFEIHNPVYKDGDDAYTFFVEYLTPSGCYASKEVSFENLSIILPIDPVSDFSARKINLFEIELSWESDIQNGKLFLERADDQLDFKILKTIDLNSESSSNYFYKDSDFNQGNNYYRIKFLDHLGNQHFSDLRRVFIPDAPGLKVAVYPNPFTDKISISPIYSEQEFEHFTLTTVQGEVLVNGQLKNQIIVLDQLNYLSKGVYLLRLKSLSSTKTIKLLKN